MGAARLDESFSALASDVRRQLLARLRRGPLAVAELVAGVAVSGPAVSKHLKALEAAGLVARTVEGRQHRIRRVPGALAAARDWLTTDAAGAAPPAVAIAGRPTAPVPVRLPIETARAQARALAASLAPVRALLAAEPLPSAPLDAYRVAALRRRLAADAGLAALLRDALAGADGLTAALPGLDGLPVSQLETLTAAASRLSWLLACHPALADLGLLAPAA